MAIFQWCFQANTPHGSVKWSSNTELQLLRTIAASIRSYLPGYITCELPIHHIKHLHPLTMQCYNNFLVSRFLYLSIVLKVSQDGYNFGSVKEWNVLKTHRMAMH